MEIVVNDTNLFFDLIEADLLETFFSLPLEVHTTDFVVDKEIMEPEQRTTIQKFINRGKLIVSGFSFDEITEINSLQEKVRGLSLTDCSVWYYSKLNGYTLLSGDKLLRNSALKDKVVVKGLLFVFDMMVELKKLAPIEAGAKLEHLVKNGTRLPLAECKRRIEMWKKL